jgi:hypothetical protein
MQERDQSFQAQLSRDLRDFVEERTLVRLTLESVNSELQGEGSERVHVLAPGWPRVFLTVLTYGYGTGVYASEHIEAQAQRDPSLRYLAARLPFSGDELRRFRRMNRPLVEDCLSRLIALVWQMPGSCGSDRELAEGAFKLAAQRRVAEAIQADSMALDF